MVRRWDKGKQGGDRDCNGGSRKETEMDLTQYTETVKVKIKEKRRRKSLKDKDVEGRKRGRLVGNRD